MWCHISLLHIINITAHYWLLVPRKLLKLLKIWEILTVFNFIFFSPCSYLIPRLQCMIKMTFRCILCLILYLNGDNGYIVDCLDSGIISADLWVLWLLLLRRSSFIPFFFSIKGIFINYFQPALILSPSLGSISEIAETHSQILLSLSRFLLSPKGT